MEENLRFKIDWASLLVGIKFIVFALFYFVFEGNFHVQAPRGLIIIGGVIQRRVFCVTSLGGLYLGGAYTWRGLFLEFYSIHFKMCTQKSYNIETTLKTILYQVGNTFKMTLAF